jgi:hypothetical protein
MSHLKIESARRQLGTALALYLQDRDPVSVHCLANGGCELIEYYAEKSGAKPLTTIMLQSRPDLDIGKLRRIQREHWTAFKHPFNLHTKKEREDDELLHRFTDVENDHALFIGWYDYASAAGAMPIEAQVHQLWYFTLYPEKLDPKHDRKVYENYFPKLRIKPRLDQKKMLNDAINTARTDQSIRNDPRTDTRPLMIGWP